MAVIAVRSVEQRASLFFTDLEELFCEYEQHQSASDISLKENLTIRLKCSPSFAKSISICIRRQQWSSSRSDQEFSVDVLELLEGVNFPVEQDAHK